MDATYSATVFYSGPIQYLEHVVVQISISVPISRGKLQIELLSPSGTRSILLHPRERDTHPGSYIHWPFMSVMFWGENATGLWTLDIATSQRNGVANVSNVEFFFYGVSSVPEAVRNIPDHCHTNCQGGCAGKSSRHCDSCRVLRNTYTLECIESCPQGYANRSGYCYNSSLPNRTCSSPLKNKEGGRFSAIYEEIGCIEAGYSACCTNTNCVSAPFSYFQCFCDDICYKFKDCCLDIKNTNCSKEAGEFVISHS